MLLTAALRPVPGLQIEAATLDPVTRRRIESWTAEEMMVTLYCPLPDTAMSRIAEQLKVMGAREVRLSTDAQG